ncbi:MAG: DUF4397 domain-containing protein [Burkholderiales bacterium]
MKRLLLLASILFTGLFAACGSTVTPTPKANLRVMHASPDAGAVDVLLDDKKILTGFAYKSAIAFDQVDAGARNIKVNATGVTTSLINTTQNLAQGRYYTVIAANTASAAVPLVVDDDNSAPPAGSLRLRFVHAAPAAPAVDIYISKPSDDITLASAPPAIENASFKTISPALDITAGVYIIRVTSAGNRANILFDSGENTFGEGANLTLVAVEQNNLNKSPISLVNLTRNTFSPRGELLDINAQARVIHASPDAPAVDLYVDTVLAQSGLAYGANTAYLPLLAKLHNFKVNSTGTATSLVNSDLTIGASKSYSIYVMGFAATPPQYVTIADLLEPPTAGNANLRIVHASPNTAGVDVFQDAGTAAVFTALPYGTGSGYIIVPAGTHSYKFNLTGTVNAALPPQSFTLEAGRAYSAVMLGSSVAGAANPLALKLITDR